MKMTRLACGVAALHMALLPLGADTVNSAGVSPDAQLAADLEGVVSLVESG